MSVSLRGRRTVGALLAEIEVLMKGGRIQAGDEIRVDLNEGLVCTSRIDSVGVEDVDKPVLVLTLQHINDGTP